MKRLVAAVLFVGLVAATLVSIDARSHAAEPTLEELRRDLVKARSALELGAALDALSSRIGKRPGFSSASSYGDWLGRLDEGTAKRPRVLLTRGWAYVTARQGSRAIPLLEEALERGVEAGAACAYLGEARRQSGEPDRAIEAHVRSAKEGYREPFLMDSVRETALEIRRRDDTGSTIGLPAYAEALGAFLEARSDPSLHATAARWMLEDLDAYEGPGRDNTRRREWARFAADHALAALRAVPQQEGGARLAYDAAAALEPDDRECGGRSPRFDLLAWACRLGDRPESESHDIPQVLPLLAEAAAREGRYELAWRMAMRRLRISDSPAARRVLAALPPDVGE